MPRRVRMPLLALLLAVVSDAPLRGMDKKDSADTITPIASDILEYKTEIEADGKPLRVTISYAQQGGTVFILPVWHVKAVHRIVSGTRPQSLKPSDLIHLAESKGEQRLEFDVVNLLDEEKIEKAIQAKVKARIADQKGGVA